MTAVLRLVGPAIALIGLGSCGQGGFGGGGPGEVEIRLGAYTTDGVPAGFELEGTIDVDARAYLIPGVIPLEITRGIDSATLDLASGDEVPLASSSVRSGFYNEIEIVFRSVSVHITGPELDTPRELTVDLGGDGLLRVDNDSPVLVDDRGRVVIVVRLGGDDWIPAEGTVVSESALADAVRITFRRE